MTAPTSGHPANCSCGQCNVVQRCDDCGGPTRRAFDITDAYVSCRRCGHVFPTRTATTKESKS